MMNGKLFQFLRAKAEAERIDLYHYQDGKFALVIGGRETTSIRIKISFKV
jgi:hypothetical protein